ncbi:hypothetical protein HUK65_14555 [Rhodobacteraceae bacterium 2376]|uniref:Uncharacterized protein n=1 Tax=Rhabdonatronobacter sediminivivens TaxID=2743469 RepID=A0A7Z0L209_9RHOB|nr:hypothetical protein [Rhabdonatronobacter sediminivivens]NYS26213.1 hypothetical protein [Rhabdonatronobacter sediminivivens]
MKMQPTPSAAAPVQTPALEKPAAKKPAAKKAPARAKPAAAADKAEMLFHARDWTGALGQYRLAAQAPALQSWAWFRIARCHEELGESLAAREFHTRALLAEPQFFSRLRHLERILNPADPADPLSASAPPPVDTGGTDRLARTVTAALRPMLARYDWDGAIAALSPGFAGERLCNFVRLGACIDPQTGLGHGAQALEALYLRCHLERALERGDGYRVIPDTITEGEDHKFTRQEILLSAQDMLERLYGAHADALDYRLVAVHISDQLRFWETSIARWDALCTDYPQRPEYRVSLAFACMKNRAFDRAAALLDQIEPTRLDAEERRKVARIRREITERRNAGVLADFLETLATGQIAQAKEIFLDHVIFMDEMNKDQHLPVLHALMAAAQKIHTGDGDFFFSPDLAHSDLFFGADLPDPPHKPLPDYPAAPPFRLLSVAGFNYSGSGAVGDFLSDYEPVQVLDRSQCYIGAWRLLQAQAGDRADYCRQLCRFVMDACLGLVDTSLSGPEVDSANWFKRRCLLRAYTTRKLATAPMIEALCRMIDFAADAHQPDGGNGDDGAAPEAPDHQAGGLEQQLRDFLVWHAIAPQVTPGKTLVVINNDLKASKIEASRLLPACPTITAFRDPRDQFVAQMRESTFNRRDADAFVEMIEAHNREYLEGRARVQAAGIDSMELRFEAFVTGSALRDRVLAFAGLSADTPRVAAPSFDPARSRVSIGIHQGYEDRAAIDRGAGMKIYLPAPEYRPPRPCRSPRPAFRGTPRPPRCQEPRQACVTRNRPIFRAHRCDIAKSCAAMRTPTT